ncbi:pumilio homolog 4-like isoform X3 [Carica papaya]|uniref:pumilio homolog 4-like isoform X3 n=1 Tax=Carica papaya TaxID=3649 RepID=UPI000B8CA417|nr:pumilio homolog 4-like isoform X3 [Carica papaya]
MMRSQMRGSPGSWQSEFGNAVDGRYMSLLLDEFKNKAQAFELSDIADHVVEFSTDQYGSCFVQQKLETATVEEKNLIFPEIVPHARTLFFEYRTESQRGELASQLIGHVFASQSSNVWLQSNSEGSSLSRSTTPKPASWEISWSWSSSCGEQSWSY